MHGKAKQSWLLFPPLLRAPPEVASIVVAAASSGTSLVYLVTMKISILPFNLLVVQVLC